MKSSRKSSRIGERIRRFVVLGLALSLVGGVYAALAPTSGAQEAQNTDDAAYVREGQRLFNEGCISCHGPNAEGVPDRGPSLIGVGAAAVEFQVSSGRMPLARQEAQAPRKKSFYDADETAQLAAYVQSLGGGPELPKGSSLRNDKEISMGGELFRVNCAACHAFSSNGGALSSGKSAPPLSDVTDRQLYAAMLTGPENMPVFGENQLSSEEKKAIVSYVQNMQDEKDPGGFGIGRTGPVPEGLVAFLVGIVVLMFATLWIAGKS